MGKLFGTDGIRGVANEYPMTSEMALNVGRAIASMFKHDHHPAKVIIGKDTRISGQMLEYALASGVCSVGGLVYLAGTLPTPGVAVLTATTDANAGIVISASHNPYFDNGIKIYGASGFKLSDDREAEIEKVLLNGDAGSFSQSVQETGMVHELNDAASNYMDFLRMRLSTGFSLNGLKIILDCSNGATYQVAPQLFSDLGADVESVGVEPDGKNINAGCGSQHPEILMQKVKETGAHLGLAFDGDGDRLIAVDETGGRVSGDRILAICARDLKEKGRLQNNLVVSTVMSNLGLRIALKELGIGHVMTQVGDRYVMEEMKSSGAVIGGEDSGHMIFLDAHTTGDGIFTALRLLEAIRTASRPLSELAKIMQVFPQVLINVNVRERRDIESVPEIQAAIREVEEKLGEQGRVLVRYSGTQPKCRIMVEGPGEQETHEYCQHIAEVVRRVLGEQG
jgi:phosphoglucosamine mutase